MERLTEWIADGKAIPRMDLRRNGHDACVKRLAELEDMEEAGLLLKVPCKVSSTVHIIDDFEMEYERPAVVTGIEIDEDEIYIMISDGPQTGSSSSYTPDDFGDTVFLTRDEAEERLRELVGDDI